MKKIFNKIICLFIFVGLNWAGLFAIGQTVARFNDTETSQGNIYQAGTLDFSIINKHSQGSIGLTEKTSLGSVITNSGSLDFQYIVEAEKISGSDDFCNALKLEAELNGIEKYDDDLMLLSTVPDTMLGSWTFEFKMPFSASNIPHGDVCEIDLVFKGWQTNVANYGDGGFFDEERIHVNLTSRMIVLNEFLPNPEGSEYGFNFGNDASDMPQGEWVELYNNSDFDFDLAGYYLTDADGNRIDIEGCRINSGNTVIPGKEFLVIYRNGGGSCNSHNFSLNNGGDTINLFNNSSDLIDSYTYTTDSDYCDLEPTPGDGNSTDTSGDCNTVPPNKSYARIPDGIGQWVDPIPTPGNTNRIEDEIINNVDNITSSNDVFYEEVEEEVEDDTNTENNNETVEGEEEDAPTEDVVEVEVEVDDEDQGTTNIEDDENTEEGEDENNNENQENETAEDVDLPTDEDEELTLGGEEDIVKGEQEENTTEDDLGEDEIGDEAETDEGVDTPTEAETNDETTDEEIVIEEDKALPAEEDVTEEISENEEVKEENLIDDAQNNEETETPAEVEENNNDSE